MTRQITIDKTKTEGFAARVKNRGQSNGTQTVELYKDGVLVTDEANLTLTPDETTYVLEAPTVFSDASHGQTLTMEVVTDNMTRTVEVFIDAIPDGVDNHWTYSEGIGKTVGDSVGSADISYSGLSWNTTQGLDGSVGVTDGVDDKGTATPSSSGSNTFSFWTWFYVDDASNQQVVWSENQNTTNSANWVLEVARNSGGQVSFWLNNGDGGSNVEISYNSLNSQTWYFAAVRAINANQCTFYVGSSSDLSLTTVGSQNYDQGVEVTGSSNVEHHFAHWDSLRLQSGRIDDSAWNGSKVFSEKELEDRFNSTKGNYL